MLLPAARGPVSAAIVQALARQDPTLLMTPASGPPRDPVVEEDLQLALWICYELHYRGFEGTDPTWEWQPQLIAVRRALEQRLLVALRRDVVVPAPTTTVAVGIRQLVDADTGPSVSRYLQRQATLEQFR